MESLRENTFSELYIESDDELFEQNKRIRALKELENKFINLKLKNEKRFLKETQKKIEEDKKYSLSLKRTKIYEGLVPLNYVKIIEEDNYDISSYLSLSREISSSLNTNIFACAITYGGYQIFDKDEYLYLVKIMEQAKNPWYYNPIQQLKDVISISEQRLSKCYFSIDKHFGYEFAAIYQIYKFLLWDSPNYRKLLKEQEYWSLKEVIDKDLKDFVENPHDLHSKIEQEYVLKYFELGKTYYAKRNNFKILFRNYLRFIGKIMIIKNNL